MLSSRLGAGKPGGRTPTQILKAATAAAITACAIVPAIAHAANTTTVPTAAVSRTFSSSSHGWTSSVDLNGLGCGLPGVLCANGTAFYQPSGGNPDGYIRSNFQTVTGVVADTTVDWTSPTFTAPADTDSASLSVDIRSDASSVLSVAGAGLTLQANLIDTTTPGTTAIVPATALTDSGGAFQTRTFTVPAGSFTPGHVYKLQLATNYNTTVSAFGASGNVDYDNVSLSLVDSFAPTGLTATVPGSAPARVTGSITPQGLSTGASVAYGTTLGYGSTAGPATVTGAGAQPYTIGLPETLAPSTTYHYAVTATNSDGSASTGDQTFTTPAAPISSGPASITGAGDSRARVANFTVGAGTTGATVQVLDANDTLVDSFPDSDLDGVVPITLPDSDATYHLRVVRTNGFSTTSSPTASVALGRAAANAGAAPNGGSISEMLSTCFGSRLVVTDVRRVGTGKVRVAGLSALAAGTSVEIRDEKNNAVAKTTTSGDGTFSATVKPSKRRAKRQKYGAVSGATKSAKLALVRTNAISLLSSANGVVTIKGTISKKIAKQGKKVRFQVRGGFGAAGCAAGGPRLTLIGSARLSKSGRYTVKVKAPAGTGSLIIRTLAQRGASRAYSTFNVAR